MAYDKEDRCFSMTNSVLWTLSDRRFVERVEGEGKATESNKDTKKISEGGLENWVKMYKKRLSQSILSKEYC